MFPDKGNDSKTFLIQILESLQMMTTLIGPDTHTKGAGPCTHARAHSQIYRYHETHTHTHTHTQTHILHLFFMRYFLHDFGPSCSFYATLPNQIFSASSAWLPQATHAQGVWS